MSAHWDDRLEHVAVSDVGLRRANNQDSFSVMLAANRELFEKRGHLFLVADGMGAHAAGELASKLAADNIPHAYSKTLTLSPPTAIVKSIKDINKQINDRGKANADFHGMGTTCSVLVLLPQGALVAHVGDSRVYRLRPDRVLEQLSFDHSLAWELLARGKVSESQVALQVPKNIITRSLGPSPEVEVDLEGPLPINVGDTFLLCSDGLSGQVEDPEIGSMLGALSPSDAARALTDLANLRGGPDNITVIVVRVTKAMMGPPGEGFAADGAAGKGFGGWLKSLGSMLSGGGTQPGGRYGRGPYRIYPANSDAKFTHTLASLTQELREAATAERWSVDWREFNSHCDQAAHVSGEQNYTVAIREYSLAMSFMMSELRNQRRRK
ncbi:MAG TPA: PP2C family serine/threonine-protein phosphatase [Pirellulales bacterium]